MTQKVSKRVIWSKKVDVFMRAHRPKTKSVTRAEYELAVAKMSHKEIKEPLYGSLAVRYSYYASREGARYWPQLRYQTEKGGLYHTNGYMAKQMGYTSVLIPWPDDVIELPIPPWLEAEDHDSDYSSELVPTPIITTLCFRSEVAALTEPFIRYLKDLAKGKVK